MQERVLLHLGEFSLDPVAKVLFKNGEPVHLTRKAVETLLVLVENPGRVLTKEEIMSAVWTGRVVDEANLAQNIAVIRKTLNAGKGTAAYIETFPGRGYRIHGPVTRADPTAPPLPPPPKRRWWPYAAAVAVVLITAALLLIPGAADPAEFRVTAATRMTGKEYQPAISPDGSRIAFLWAPDGRTPPSLWIKPLGDQPARLLARGPEHYSSPTWSRDGNELAFLRITGSSAEIAILNAAGVPRAAARVAAPVLAREDRLLDWSGTQFAVATSDGLVLVSSGGSQHRLTRTHGDVDPRFTPDGRRVSFLRVIHRAHQEVYSVPISGGEPERITNWGRRISSHQWTPDGLIASSDRGGEFRLWRVVSGTPKPLGVYSEWPIQFSFPAKTQPFVYSALHQDRNIWRLDLQDKTWTRLIASTGQDASPQYSPDGKWIAFRSDRSGHDHLWVTDVSGVETVQATHGSVTASVGKWSPDSKLLVFNDPTDDELYMARHHGAITHWTRDKLGVKGVHPVFSPDGRSIFAGGPAGIVRIPAGGGSPVPVAGTKAESLAISPGGEHLYFARERNDTTVYRVPVAGGAIEKVIDGLVPGCTSCWALSRDGIYYLAAGERQALRFRDARTGQVRTILEYPEPLWPQGSGPFSLSPDGRYLLTVRVDPSDSDVMLVDRQR